MIRKNIFLYVSYFNILFFLEIINMMFLFLAAYGKMTAIISGIVLSMLLSYHIILLYFKNELNRKIQLFLMDIHAGYSIPFLFFFIFYYNNNGIYDYVFTGLRFFMVCAEILFIIILSDHRAESLNIRH